VEEGYPGSDQREAEAKGARKSEGERE